MSCARPLWQLSSTLSGVWEELEVSFSLQKAQALVSFLQRRRHFVHSLTLSLYYLTSQPRAAIDVGEVLRQLVHSLADGALRKLTAYMDYGGNLMLGSWMVALPQLSKLSICCGGVSPVAVAASLSCLTTLTSLEVWDCKSELPDGCLPTSLRSLVLSFHNADHAWLPAAVAAATALEQLTLESPLDDAQGLQQLQNLTSLTLATGEVGVPDQVEELLALRSLKVLPEVVYAEQLALLLKLMNLTSLTLEPEDGADAGMVLAPLPAELLDLPHLMEFKVEAAIPPLSICTGAGAAAGHAVMEQAQQDPQQPNQHQHDQAHADPQAAGPQQLPSAGCAPAWAELIQGGFPALEEVEVTFADPGDLWGNTVGAEQLSPWLGLPGWLGCMRGLKAARLVAAGEVAGALREALPPGVALQTSRY
ncbi:hypothetical protein N2152v2_010943 [Parachlorella kessleri]